MIHHSVLLPTHTFSCTPSPTADVLGGAYEIAGCLGQNWLNAGNIISFIHMCMQIHFGYSNGNPGWEKHTSSESKLLFFARFFFSGNLETA